MNGNDSPDDADGQALQRVATYADMSRPMPIDLPVVAPDQSAAQAIALAFDQPGRQRQVGVHRYEDDARHAGVFQAQAELDAVAAPFGGRTDRWATFGNRP